jgi:hypothetical protein
VFTESTYLDNPNYIPTQEELNRMAKFVVTHGGRAILNDIILRGYIYALGGFFKGEVVAEKGSFKNITTPNGSFIIDDKGNVSIVGKFETNVDGNRILIDPNTRSVILYDELDRETAKMSFIESGESWTYGMVELKRYVGDSKNVQYHSQILPNIIVITDNSVNTSCQARFNSNGVEVYSLEDTSKTFSSGVRRRQTSLNEFVYESITNSEKYRSGDKEGMTKDVTIRDNYGSHTLTFTSGLLTGYSFENTEGGN